jgi:hypothetical protein
MGRLSRIACFCSAKRCQRPSQLLVCAAESLLNYLQLYYCHVVPLGWLARGVAQA